MAFLISKRLNVFIASVIISCYPPRDKRTAGGEGNVLPTKLESYDTRFSDFRGERVGGTVLYIPRREVGISTYFGKARARNAH